MEATATARHRLPQLAKYEVIEEIGHGGMATVYRARDKRLGREVAVKVIHPHLRDSREVVTRFNNEAQAVAKLRHPNIVEVFDVSEPGEGEQYLVVELLRGTTLRKLLQRQRAMPPEIAAAIALELLGALAHANASGVVHRDIKPENVLIEHRSAPGVAAERATPAPTSPSPRSPSGRPGEGDRTIVKLTDFGIAKLLDAQGVTSTGQVLGSPAHMAPEQIEGGDVDARADVFGMGVLLYECMVGHLPFEGNNPAQVLRRVLDGQYPEAQAERAVVGSRWSALIDRALAHAPAGRFADADAMREAVVTELDRLGVAQPKRELEAWMDDPAGYEEAHAARMIAKLCALGAEERKRGDVIQGSADYNRALAHAPDDPSLLRIVAGLNRAEARARLLRRAGAALVLMVGLTVVAFGVGKLVRTRLAADPTPVTTAVVTTAPPPPASVPASSETIPSATAPVPAPTAPRPTFVAPPPPRPIERSVSFDLTPSMGIIIGVDGTEVRRGASSGDAIKVDGKAHTLTFTCPVCTAVQREIAAGDKDETLVVKVPIKPATLVIEGPFEKTYQIVEHPEIVVRPGNNVVRMSSAKEQISVIQVGSPQDPKSVQLDAGRSAFIKF
jgi:serine/threonine-protein kinase